MLPWCPLQCLLHSGQNKLSVVYVKLQRDKQADTQTDKQTDKRPVLHSLLGGVINENRKIGRWADSGCNVGSCRRFRIPLLEDLQHRKSLNTMNITKLSAGHWCQRR